MNIFQGSVFRLLTVLVVSTFAATPVSASTADDLKQADIYYAEGKITKAHSLYFDHLRSLTEAQKINLASTVVMGVPSRNPKVLFNLINNMNHDNPDVLAILGSLNYLGEGTVFDRVNGIRMINKAAVLQSPIAFFLMGRIFQDRSYFNSALSAYSKACDAGISLACNDIGKIYERGSKELPKNTKLALEFYRKAAGMGCGWSYDNIGDCFYNGIEVNQNVDSANKYYFLAKEFEPDNGDYAIKLAYYYLFSEGHQRPDSANYFLTQASKRYVEDKDEAYHRVIQELIRETSPYYNPAMAIELAKVGASKNYFKCMVLLCRFYFYGLDTYPSDRALGNIVLNQLVEIDKNSTFYNLAKGGIATGQYELAKQFLGKMTKSPDQTLGYLMIADTMNNADTFNYWVRKAEKQGWGYLGQSYLLNYLDKRGLEDSAIAIAAKSAYKDNSIAADRYLRSKSLRVDNKGNVIPIDRSKIMNYLDEDLFYSM